MVDLVVNVVIRLPKIVRGDFYVITNSSVNANDDFEDTDEIVVNCSDGSNFSIQKETGKVFIHSKVIVIGRFPDGTDGDPDIPVGQATLSIESEDGDPKCDEIPVRIVDPPPLSTKTVIPIGEETTHYTLGVIANPGLQKSGSAGDNPPFLQDPIMTKRPDFHKKVINILETLFDQSEDVFRDPDIEPHLRIWVLFDATLKPGAKTALLRQSADTSFIMEPRSRDRPDLLPDFLKKYKETADVLDCVTGDTKWNRMSAWFTTSSGSGVSYTRDKKTYSHDPDVKIPGSFADTIYPFYNNSGDKMITIHEFMHAMSEKDNGRIIDLYNDLLFGGKGFEVNKKSRPSDPAGSVPGSNIPANFGEYEGTNYNSDAPNPPYLGRGGLGYPGTDNIKASYGPELRDSTNPNLMDNFPAGTAPDHSELDKLTYQWVLDRIKAKIK